ncbi:hypothetical protein IEU95_02170 [Hoyosella rhizosphaerae]|uniref:Uncharacterized protein n=1 Tax=Hoyosella rhizosphaerae TaxID=1755582 RepID=A0A916UD27_9ACTN|nr:hypothetical protein [Hoyosella rhizosphaerae]MBN4925620.1 hypothetical protein [Hoyosella rhizosphaerae]GGC69216.1 hypothetical protein GCM10011410_22550 [Hoyosella rhizosphaerae]
MSWQTQKPRPVYEPHVIDNYVTGVLAVNGLLLGVLCVLLLPSYWGEVPFPYSVLFAAIGNIVLLELALRIGYSLKRAVVPVAVWTGVVLLAFLGGPGGSTLIPTQDPRGLFLLIGGLVPVGFWMFREAMQQVGPDPSAARKSAR